MICYFSGTGNSQWVAKTLAALTSDEAVDISALLNHRGPSAVFAAGEGARIGLVFPIYAWGAPKIVNEFADTLCIGADAYVYAVCTCGDEAGRAMEKLRKLFPWKAAWSVIMPNNYIPLYDLDSPELERSKIAAARERLGLIAEKINAEERAADIQEGSLAGLKTALVNPLFKAFASSSKPFTAEDRCTGCGLCQRSCPQDVIRMSQGKPQWVKKRCVQCMSCIHGCPVRAIQYGKATKARGRYHFPEGD